jgi:7-keto-8-aminopelargonate synthetase-like enzyme
MVDDAHALASSGRTKRHGFSFWTYLSGGFFMGTFSKSLASIGGFIAGDASVINYLKHNSRALILSSLPPASLASVSTAIDIMLKSRNA